MHLSTSAFKELMNGAKHLLLFLLCGLGLAATVALSNGAVIGRYSADDWLVNATPGAGGHTWQRIPDMEAWMKDSNGAPRMLILGPSSAYRGIVPGMLDSAFNCNAFNAASASQAPATSEKLLRYVAANTSLSHVLLDLNPDLWDDEPDAGEDLLDMLVNNPEVMPYGPRLGLCTPRLAGTWLYFSWKRLLLKWLNRTEHIMPAAAGEQYAGKGFVYSGMGHIPAHFSNTKIAPVLTAGLVRPVLQIMQLCTSKGIHFVVILPKVLNLAPAWAHAQATGMINANDQNLDTASFYDDVHLRAAGARANTTFIITQLRRKHGSTFR